MPKNSSPGFAWPWYPCPAQWLVNGLAIALQQLKIRHDLNHPIPIAATKVLGQYRSPLALSLGGQHQPDLLEQLVAIAQQHSSQQLQSLDFVGSASSPQQLLTLQVQPSGWIEGQASLELQLLCLHRLRSPWPPILTERQEQQPKQTISPEILGFELQYAYARCASLLRLVQTHCSYDGDSLLQSEYQNWLRAYFQMGNAESLLEQQIWIRLLNFSLELQPGAFLLPDHSGSQPPSIAEKVSPLDIPDKKRQALAANWVKLFQKFYSQCRCFGLHLPTEQNLLVLRIAIIQGLQNVFRFLLNDLLQMRAPEFL